MTKQKTCLICGKKLPPPSGRKYCSNNCYATSLKLASINRYELSDVLPSNAGTLRKCVLAANEHKCSICGTISWNGKEVHLIVDHIDGNAGNSKKTNIRLVCPNCDAQLPTYKGRNKGRGRVSRRLRYAKGASY